MTVYNSMSDIAVVGCCCCSAWLGLGELCVFVTVSAREYRREFVLVCVAEYLVVHRMIYALLYQVVDLPRLFLVIHCGSKKTRQLWRTITTTQFSRF